MELDEIVHFMGSELSSEGGEHLRLQINHLEL